MEIWAACLFLPANRSPPPAPPARHRADAGSIPPPGLPLASRHKGAYAPCRIDADTAHFLMVTFWKSEVAIWAFAGDDISVAKYYDFDKDLLLELEPYSAH